MSRWIDADALIKRWDEMSARGRTEFDQEIMVAPSIDICFCRECSKHNTHRCHMAFDLITTEADDFCSYGCRKESE